MLPVGEAAAEGVYRLVDACYESSLAASSNPFIRPKRTCSREAAWLPYGARQYRGNAAALTSARARTTRGISERFMAGSARGCRYHPA
jgi:hypothetical protein